MTARRARWSRLANCTLIARKINNDSGTIKAQAGESSLTWAFVVERVTGIEPALSAWEADVLPLNYTRAARGLNQDPGSPRHRTGASEAARRGRQARRARCADGSRVRTGLRRGRLNRGRSIRAGEPAAPGTIRAGEPAARVRGAR